MSKIIGKLLNEDQIAIVDMVKQTLAQALEGDFTTIGIVVCMKDGFAHAMCGPDAAQLNLACDEMKSTILDKVKKASAERQSRRSNILQVRQ